MQFLSPSYVTRTNLNMEDNDVFFAGPCPHYSAVIRHHYSRFDHYIDSFLCEPLTAVLMREQAVCNMRENGILRLSFSFSSRPKVFPAKKELWRLCQQPGNYYT